MKNRFFLVAVAWAAICTLISAQAKGPITGDKKRPNPRRLELSQALADSPISERIWDVRDTSDHENRVTAGLEWLADHQSPDGSWSTTNFVEHSKRIGADRTGNIEYREVGEEDGDLGWTARDSAPGHDLSIGLTSLTIMAFTAAGYSHTEGAYATLLASAVEYLFRHQEIGGTFGEASRRFWVYEQSTAIIALTELYALSGDADLRLPIEAACIRLADAKTQKWGWGYNADWGESDTSNTGFAVFALATAKSTGILVRSDEAYAGATNWLDLITLKVSGYWKTGYSYPGSNNARLKEATDFRKLPAMEGVAGWVWVTFGEKIRKNKRLKEYVKLMRERDHLPQWSRNHIDMQYWWWSSLFLRHAQKKDWKPWREKMETALIEHQRGYRQEDVDAGLNSKVYLDEHGSWDPVGAWGPAGGRVYSTAMGVILLGMEWR